MKTPLNIKIEKNLDSLLHKSINNVKNFDFNQFKEDGFSIDQNKMLPFLDEKEFELISNNKVIKRAFETSIDYLQSIDKKMIIASFCKDIEKSLKEINTFLQEHPVPYLCQIITFEYNYYPQFCWSGFGEGDYSLLKQPEYFNYNYKNELFNGIGLIDFKDTWDIVSNLEEVEKIHEVGASEIINVHQQLFKIFTFQCLHDAIHLSRTSIIDTIPSKLPLHIYANEHDMELLSIYVIE